MEYLEKFIDKFLGPIANYMSNSAFFSSLTDAFMKITPVTLGAAVLLIIGNFPVSGWIDYLREIGIYSDFVAVQGATMDAISIFVVYNLASAYTKRVSKYSSQIAGLIAIACFFMLMPQVYVLHTVVDNSVTASSELTALSKSYIGGEGIIVAIFVGYLVARLYVFFNDKKLVIKLPATVPANVSESLRPSILSGFIFIFFFLIRLAFRHLPFLIEYNNIFTFIGVVIQQPLSSIVSEPAFLIFALTIANVFWYFGIHPQLVYSVLTPMVTSITIANMTAFATGQPIPYLSASVIALACGTGFGGQGGTIGLIVAMSRAKSERFKSMFKLSAVPSIFNINEPLIFGMPIMMNPYFFFPMMLSPLLMGLSGYIVMSFVDINLNPMINLPWTTPALFSSFARGGWPFLLVAVLAFIISILVWAPFFFIADKKEYAIEQNENK